jgi:hypothetical protein
MTLNTYPGRDPLCIGSQALRASPLWGEELSKSFLNLSPFCTGFVLRVEGRQGAGEAERARQLAARIFVL